MQISHEWKQKNVSKTLTDRATPQQAEVLVILAQTIEYVLVWTWGSIQKRQLLRQDIEEYPTLYYKMDQMSREKYIVMDYTDIEISCADLSRHSMSDDAEKFAQPLLC